MPFDDSALPDDDPLLAVILEKTRIIRPILESLCLHCHRMRASLEAANFSDDPNQCSILAAGLTYWLTTGRELLSRVDSMLDFATRTKLEYVFKRQDFPLSKMGAGWRVVPSDVLRALEDAAGLLDLRLGRLPTRQYQRPTATERPLQSLSFQPTHDDGTRAAGDESAPTLPSAKQPIPNPSAPFSLGKIADAWSGDMTAKKLRGLIDTGAVKANALNRQTWIVCLDDVPEKGRKKLTPTPTNSA